MASIKPEPLKRTLREVALEIRADFGGKSGYLYAEPYVTAMSRLETSAIEGSYGQDAVDGVVRRFLVNASSWRGEKARAIKAELKAALAHHDNAKKASR